MALFKEHNVDPKQLLDHAEARVAGHGDRHNLSPLAYLIPLLGAVAAILIAAYALTRPGVAERLRQQAAPPRTLEVELE